MRYFDALDFAQNPGAAPPLTAGRTFLDSCGRYHAIDLQQPTFGFIAVVTDDAPGSGQDTHVQTAVTLAAAEARPASGFHAYATRRTTDAAWTSSAGLTGMTFGQRGVFLSIFLHHGAPVAGVRVTRDASSIPADDFYFSDAGITRSTIDPARTATGPNGSVLAINGPTPITHAGTGGAPAGCEWPSSLAMGIPGVVLVQRKEAQLPGGAPCP